MPLRRAVVALALILCPLGAAAEGFADLPKGRCVGGLAQDLPSLGDQPLDLRAVPKGTQWLEALAAIGFSTDPATGRASDPEERPVGKEYLRWFQAPADFSRLHAPAFLWVGWMNAGYRLDEKTCALVARDGKSLSNIQFLHATRVQGAAQTSREALEVLSVELSGLPPGAPVPDSVRRRMEQLARAGVHLPPALQRELDDLRAAAGPLAGDVQAAYLEQARLFDGKSSKAALVAAAAPTPWNYGSAAGRRGPIAPEEQRLGGLLARDVTARFSKTERGRRLLSRFATPDGAVHLPTILVLKTNQTPDEHGQYGAYFDGGHDVMVLNHWQVESSLLSRLTPEQKARVEKDLGDPRALREELEKDPKDRSEVIGDIDEIFFHELVHAWQDRRSRLDVEMMRGNAPGYSPIAKEHEAFREQMRFDLDKARTDADALMRSGYFPWLGLPLLRGYDSFADEINRIYLTSFPGLLPMRDIAAIQKERESAARTLLARSRGLYLAAVEKLKLRGLWHGSEALAAAQSDLDAREARFKSAVLPALRAQAAGPVVSAYEDEKHFDWAEAVLAAVDPATPGLAAALRRWAQMFRAEAATAPPPAGPELDVRLQTLDRYENLSRSGVLPADAQVDAWYRDAARRFVARCLDQAKTKTGAEADQLRRNAKSWSAVLPDGDLVRARAQAGVDAK